MIEKKIRNEKKWFRAHMAELLGIFVAAIIFAFGYVDTHIDNIVLHVKRAQTDSLQVFFSNNGVYSEQNSVRTINFDGIKSIFVNLPRDPLYQIRIDPATMPGITYIEKIDFNHALGAKTLTPKELLELITGTNNVSRLEVTADGLLVESIGNDPMLFFQFGGVTIWSQIIGFYLVVASILLMIISVSKLFYKSELSSFYVYCALISSAFISSLAIALIFYPGFMSFDTLYALRGARNSVTDSTWPPMVSYVWRLVDIFSMNPSAMHFMQVFTLLTSISIIIYKITKCLPCSAFFLLVYLAVPVILGTVAVIWKDVLMSSFLLASVVLLLAIEKIKSGYTYLVLLTFTVALVFIGVSTRHNAIVAAVPIVFYLAHEFLSKFSFKKSVVKIGSILLGSALLLICYNFKHNLVDRYSFPEFVRLNDSTDSFISTVRVLDIAGASLCSERNLFVDVAPDLSMNDLKILYDPKHINLSKGLFERVKPDHKIDAIWYSLFYDHPACSFANKLYLAKYMLGINDGQQFLVTHAGVDKNEYGYAIPGYQITYKVFDYILKASDLLIFRPWVVYILAIVGYMYLIHVKFATGTISLLFFSGTLYFIGSVFFGNAADARLLFYTTTCYYIIFFTSSFELFRRSKKVFMKSSNSSPNI